MDRIGCDFLRIEVEGARQNLECKAGRDAVHSFVDSRCVAVFLDRLRARIGVLQAFAIVDSHLEYKFEFSCGFTRESVLKRARISRVDGAHAAFASSLLASSFSYIFRSSVERRQ